MVNLKTKIGKITLKNPVIAASGTFAFGREMSKYYELSQLGGISSKGLTLRPRLGNEAPRLAECAAGMLNSVGLQNPGIEYFLQEELPHMLTFNTVIIANIAGYALTEYVEMAKLLEQSKIDVIELNLSCPNLSGACMSFGSDARLIREVVAAVRNVTNKPLWVKLTPNVTSIIEMAAAAEKAGADAISLINTLLGMAVDLDSRRPLLRNNTGGLSGPAIKPIAIRMVDEVFNSVDIPIIGMGGIMKGQDALEFMLVGASAVQIGTANLIKPTACLDIINEMSKWLEEHGLSSFDNFIGSLQKWD